MDQSLISVIVPIYKVQDYLDECVESIINQTYSNIEIILVDDGSPDECPNMCDAWAKKDSRIRVVHKKMVDSLRLVMLELKLLMENTYVLSTVMILYVKMP